MPIADGVQERSLAAMPQRWLLACDCVRSACASARSCAPSPSFRQCQIIGDLLVELAAADPARHLNLCRGQVSVAACRPLIGQLQRRLLHILCPLAALGCLLAVLAVNRTDHGLRPRVVCAFEMRIDARTMLSRDGGSNDPERIAAEAVVAIPGGLLLSAAYCLGESGPHFLYAFATSTGMPPLRYLTGARVERAPELLRDSRR